MASRILLISTNVCTTPDSVFPLGLAHLTAALREAGHSVRWRDVLVPERSLEETLREWKPDVAGISLRNIDDVLIRKRETFYDSLAEITRTIREHAGCPVVLGGSGFSIFPEALLRASGADYGVAGPGEAAFPALIHALERGEREPEIPGLVRLRDGQCIQVPQCGRVDPTRIADTDRPGSIVAYYLRTGGMLNLQTQRGCSYRCCYCTYPLIEGRGHRHFEAEAVADSFEQAARLGARYVFIVDSVFNSSQEHVATICEALIRRKSRLAWGCFLRPQGITTELMDLMVRAGLAHAEFGSDSFSNTVLRAYHKGLTFEDILKSSECARRAGVDFCHFLIAGGPGETRETLRESFSNSQLLPVPVILAVVGMRIYPGTALHRQALAEKRITPETDLLQPQYYISASLTQDEVFAELQSFARLSPSWMAGDPAPAYARLVERLRSRGVVGPLWSYFAMIQRLWPQGVTEST